MEQDVSKFTMIDEDFICGQESDCLSSHVSGLANVIKDSIIGDKKKNKAANDDNMDLIIDISSHPVEY